MVKMDVKLVPSYTRVYPRVDLTNLKRLTSIDVAKNERVSFQVAMRNSGTVETQPILVVATAENARVRRVGLVPVKHFNQNMLNDPLETDGIGELPGFVPDVLEEDNEMIIGPTESRTFWITVDVADLVAAGKDSVEVLLKYRYYREEKLTEKKLRLPLKIWDVELPPRKDFDVTHWFYADQIIDWYKTDLFDDRFWELFEKYARDIVAHGQNCILVPVFTPSLDGVKRPSQLLKVKKLAKGKYSFDWSDVHKYISIAKRAGVEKFEWAHLFTQWGCKYALRIYEGQGVGEKLLWPVETEGTSDTYRNFLKQFLPELRAFLDKERIFKRSLFHVSDEPHGEVAEKSYAAGRALLRELAPWMKCMDALSDINFARKGLVDMPVPSISVAPSFVDEGFDCWCYYCGGPRGSFLNHSMDIPLTKVVMHAFLFWRWPFKGFLHWGLNYWCVSQHRELIDPFSEQSGAAWPWWSYGDTFLVYPGKDGPIDSMRWEVFGEVMQDYQLLQAANAPRAFKEITSFGEFPKNPEWREKMRRKLLASLSK